MVTVHNKPPSADRGPWWTVNVLLEGLRSTSSLVHKHRSIVIFYLTTCRSPLRIMSNQQAVYLSIDGRDTHTQQRRRQAKKKRKQIDRSFVF